MKSYTGTGYTIYAHVNKQNGKMYIGQTKAEDLTRRWTGGCGYKGCKYFYSAIQKYGWDGFDHVILQTGLTADEVNEYERAYISFFETNTSERGYNIQEGGQHSKCISDEARQKLSKLFSGGKSPVARSVVVFDLQGNRIAEFSCVNDCAAFLGCSPTTVSRALHMQSVNTVMGHICKFKEDADLFEVQSAGKTFRPYENIARPKPVAQYDLNGKFIHSFPSILSASAETGVACSYISGVLSTKRHRNTAGGYQWRYFDGNTSDIPPSRKRGELTRGKNHYHARAIIQMDKNTGRVIREFGSIVDATRAVPHCSLRALQYTLVGINHTCAGYKWAYKE